MATVTDTFTRANEAPLGPPWAISGELSSFNLTGNVAVPTALGSDCGTIYNGTGAPVWAANQSSKAKLTVTGTSGGGAGPGLFVRHASAAKTGYRFATDHAATNNCEIARFINGTFTSLSVFTQAWNDGDVWELRAEGPATATVLTVYRNGVSVRTITVNSSIATGAPGIAYSSASTAASIDDWIGTDQFAEDRDAPGTFGPGLPTGPPGLRFPSQSPILPNEPKPTRPLRQLHLTQDWNTAMQPQFQANFESQLDFMTGFRGTPQWDYYKAWNAPFLPVAGYINTFGEGTYTWPQQLDSDGATLYLPFGTPDGAGAYERPSRDLRSQAYRDLFVDACMAIVGDGGEGIFLDDVNVDYPKMFARAFGSPSLTNFDTGAYYTSPSTGQTGWVALLADFVTEITQRVRLAKPTARFFFNTQWAWDLTGRWTDPRVARIFDACDYVTLEGGASDANIYGGPGSNGGTDFAWRTLWNFIKFVHSRGKGVVTFSRSSFGSDTPARNRAYEMAHYHITRDPTVRDMVGVWRDYDVWPTIDPVYFYDLDQRLTPSIDDGNQVSVLYKRGMAAMIPGDIASGVVMPDSLRDTQIAIDSPSVWWKFDDIENKTKESVGGLDLTVTGTPTWDGSGWTCKTGDSLARADAAALRLNASDWTLEFEITAPNPLPASSTFQQILSKGWATVGGWLLYWNGTTHVFDYWGGDAAATATATGMGLIDGETALCAITYTNATQQIRFYKNGVLVGGPLSYLPNTESADPFRLNLANQGDAANGWRYGRVVIFPSTLSSDRLTMHYQNFLSSTAVTATDTSTLSDASATAAAAAASDVSATADVSSTTANVGVTDALAHTDAPAAATTTLALAVSDALTLSDASALLVTLALSANDSWALTDASSILANVSLSDAWALSEAGAQLSATLSRTDSWTLSEAVAQVAQQLDLPVTDALTQAEGTTSVATALSVSDAWAFAEGATTVAAALSRTDSFASTDLTPVLADVLSANDSGTFAEGATSLALSVATTDSWAMTDIVSALTKAVFQAANDAGTLTEGTSALAAALSVSDASALAELALIAGTVFMSASDTLTLSDLSTLTSTLALSVTDAATVTEASAIAASLNPSDTIVFTDAGLMTATQFKIAQDSGLFDDASFIALADITPSLSLPTTATLGVWAASAVLASNLTSVTMSPNDTAAVAVDAPTSAVLGAGTTTATLGDEKTTVEFT